MSISVKMDVSVSESGDYAASVTSSLTTVSVDSGSIQFTSFCPNPNKEVERSGAVQTVHWFRPEISRSVFV